MAANKALRRLETRISHLLDQVEDLKYQLDEVYAAEEHYQKQVESERTRMRKAVENARYEAEEVESRAARERYDREDAVKSLERASRYGDSWEVERAMRRLKSI